MTDRSNSTTTMDAPQFWNAAWQRVDARPVDIDLRSLVARERWRLALIVALEALVVVATLGFAIALVLRAPSLEGALWIGSLVLFFALATAFSVWNRSGLWRAAAETTAAYVALRIDRCCARILAARFAVGLVIAESLFVLGWHLVRGWLSGVLLAESLLEVVVLLLAANVLVFVWAHFYRRRAQRELEQLRGIRTALGGTVS